MADEQNQAMTPEQEAAEFQSDDAPAAPAAEPTTEEVAAARDVLARAAAAAAATDEPRAAMIALVTAPAFDEVVKLMDTAAALNRADTELQYAISMLARLRVNYLPR